MGALASLTQAINILSLNNSIMTKSKYFVLQGRYNKCWEDLTASSNKKEILQDQKDYVENEGGTYRIVSRTNIL